MLDMVTLAVMDLNHTVKVTAVLTSQDSSNYTRDTEKKMKNFSIRRKWLLYLLLGILC
jgi:hypothetical protein